MCYRHNTYTFALLAVWRRGGVEWMYRFLAAGRWFSARSERSEGLAKKPMPAQVGIGNTHAFEGMAAAPSS
jgi:hypothetical protein